MDKIKILSISHSCVVPEYRLRQAYLGMDERVELTLLTPKKWKQFNVLCPSPEKEEGHNYHLIRKQPVTFGMKKHGLRNALHLYPELDKIINNANADILELWEEPFFAVSWQAARLFKIKNPEGKIIFFSAQNLSRWYPPPFSWFEKYIYNNADCCFAMSNEVVSVLDKRGWRGENVVLPLGIEPDAYINKNGSSDKKYGASLSGVVLGYLGKINYEKGVLDFLEAVEKLKNEDIKNFSIMIVGNGPLDEEVNEKLASLGAPYVKCDGVPHKDVPEVLRCMDVVVMPSKQIKGWKEQFGRVAVEAMACSKVMVASDSGELPNVVQDGGLVFNEADVEDFSKCLKRVIESEELRNALGAKARKIAEEQYSWKSIATRQIEVYERLLGN